MRHNTQLIPAAVTALFVLIAIAGTAVAGPLEDAEDARARRDYATALRLLRSLAKQGDATAQSRLGDKETTLLVTESTRCDEDKC